MTRLAHLQAQALRLTRHLFASLSFQDKMARVLEVLANTDLKALGRSLGVIFIKKRVEGLPDIHGKPALEFPVAELEAKHKDPSRLLPSNYLEDFAGVVRGALLNRFHNQQLVETGISNWLFRFIVSGGWHTMHEGVNLSGLKGYIISGIENEIKNEVIKGKRKKRDMDSLDIQDDEGKLLHNPNDPKAPATFFERLSPHEMPKVRKELEHKVHPDAPLYLDLLLEGYTVKEIVGDPEEGKPPMLPHMRQHPIGYNNWKKTYEPKIRDIMLRVLDEAA